jgi:hypothetical protein
MKRKRRSFEKDSEEEELQEAMEAYCQGLGNARDRRLSWRRLNQREDVHRARHIIDQHEIRSEILAARNHRELIAARDELQQGLRNDVYRAQVLCCS